MEIVKITSFSVLTYYFVDLHSLSKLCSEFFFFKFKFFQYNFIIFDFYYYVCKKENSTIVYQFIVIFFCYQFPTVIKFYSCILYIMLTIILNHVFIGIWIIISVVFLMSSVVSVQNIYRCCSLHVIKELFGK